MLVRTRSQKEEFRTARLIVDGEDEITEGRV
jgi:hypothetical protein